MITQITFSVIALGYFQGEKDSALTLASLVCLLYSVMSLSNATKNEKDVVSRIM